LRVDLRRCGFIFASELKKGLGSFTVSSVLGGSMQSRRTIFRLTVNFRINDVSWRTAQSTGAFSYLPYGGAQEYSDIYDQQNDIDVAEHQAVRDTMIAVAPFLNLKAGEPNPSVAEAVRIKNNFEVLQLRGIPDCCIRR
jgi:hypothetical protein